MFDLSKRESFVAERLDQVPEARDREDLEAQVAAVLGAMLRQESDDAAAEDQSQLAERAPLPYWFIPSDWAQLSAAFQVDFVIHGMPGTENRPCNHCGTTGHVHMGPRNPGIDMCLHVHWRGRGQSNAAGASWGHWEPMVAAESQTGSSRRSRTDSQMKELLKTLQVPHYVRKSNTHGQNNCLIDSILLALQDRSYIKPLAVDARGAICSSIRRHLIEHHDLAAENQDGSQSYLSHEESFDAICNQLRSKHLDIWVDGVDADRLPIVATIFDRFHRRQLYDDSGAWAGELEEMNAQVVSMPLSASDNAPEAHIQLYCNTHDDAYGTPYHYEWISFEASGSEEEEESGMEEDDDEDNPAPPLLPTSDDDTGDDEDNPAPPVPMSGVDDDDEATPAPPLPELPLRTQPSPRSLCARVRARVRVCVCVFLCLKA